MADAFFVVQSLRKAFAEQVAVEEVNLSVAKGEFVALLGPSGCGKTTTLRMVAGFVEPTAGGIHIGGREMTWLPPNKRNMGMVFQNYALFPHLSVWDNIDFGLKMRGLSSPARAMRIKAMLAMVGLDALARRLPRELSGGQQQRVALARVLVLKPDLLLFDEPLSNLDAQLRLRMRQEIRSLQQEVGITSLFVTHDQEEAMTMADRIVVMNRGKVEQVGTPADIYDHPRSRFVADFIGRANFLEGEVVPGEQGPTFRGETGSSFPLAANTGPPGRATLCIRPEKIELSGKPGGYAGVVRSTALLGAVTEYVVELQSGETLRVQDLRRGGPGPCRAGEAVSVHWRPDAAVILGAERTTQEGRQWRNLNDAT